MSNYYYKRDEVRGLAFGNWLSIIDCLAPQLSHAIDKTGRHVGCPIHGGKDGFRLFKDAHESGGGVCNTCGTFPDGFELLMWANRWDFPTALMAVGDDIRATKHFKKGKGAHASHNPVPQTTGTTVSAPLVDEPNKEQLQRDLDRKVWLDEIAEKQNERLAREKVYLTSLIEKQEKLWDESLPISHEKAVPAQLYLRSRKILTGRLNSESIRFVPEMAYHDEDGNFIANYPTIILAIRNVEGELQSIHRIYITKKGKKANVDNVKKMMPVPFGKTVTGGAIQLSALDGSGVLSLAEGAETALAAFRAFGYPSWATVNAILLEGVIVPEDVHTAIIWADKDQSLTGERSAMALKARLQGEGVNCFIFTPPMPIPKRAKGVDWNDVLMHQGLLGFPRRELFDKVIREFREGCDVCS